MRWETKQPPPPPHFQSYLASIALLQTLQELEDGLLLAKFELKREGHGVEVCVCARAYRMKTLRPSPKQA